MTSCCRILHYCSHCHILIEALLRIARVRPQYGSGKIEWTIRTQRYRDWAVDVCIVYCHQDRQLTTKAVIIRHVPISAFLVQATALRSNVIPHRYSFPPKFCSDSEHEVLADLPCCTLRHDNPKASIRLSQTGTSTLPPRPDKSPRTNRRKKKNTLCHPEPSHQPSNPISNSRPRHLSSSSLPRSDVASTGLQLASSAARSHPTNNNNNHLSRFFSSAGFEIWLFGRLNSEGRV